MFWLLFISFAISNPLLGFEKEIGSCCASHGEIHQPPLESPQSLSQKGVDLACSYYLELAANPIGGKAHGFGNAGSLGFSMGLDLDRLARLHGFYFFTSVCFRSGVNLSARKIDNQFQVTQLYGGETIRLNELYLKETLAEGRFNLKAGRLNPGNDFLSSPFYCEYVNLAFCGNPIAMLFNTPFLEYPFATWGAYLGVKPHSDFLMKIAAYNGNLDTKENKYHGCNFTFESPQGVMWMSEWVYLLNQRSTSEGYRGNYKVGGYYISGDTALFKGGFASENFGGYFLCDQMLYRKYGPKTPQGLTYFGAFLFAPPNRNQFPFYLSSGLIYRGLIQARDDDYLSFGVAYGAYSKDLRFVQRQAQRTGIAGPYGSQPQNFETILELNYWYRLNSHLSITPDLQYVINPKGYGTEQNAFVVALQISLDLLGSPNQP